MVKAPVARVLASHYPQRLTTLRARNLRIVLDPFDSRLSSYLCRRPSVPFLDLAGDLRNVRTHVLNGPKVPVAEVSEPGEDELPLVEAAVEGTGEDWNARMASLYRLDAFGRCHDAGDADGGRIVA